jgi:hypothetical protein
MMIAKSNDCNIALFVDYENVAKQHGHRLDSILEQAAAEGTLVLLRAYADWGRFAGHKKRMQETGFELIEVPSKNGKNSADIKLTVDALETAFTKDFVDAFVIVSGDSDFVPLVVKLNELNRRAWLYVANTNASSVLEKFCHRLVLANSADNRPKPPQKSSSKRGTNADCDSPSLPGAGSVKLSKSTLRTVAWAVQACDDLATGPHPLEWLFAAMQRLDPSCDLNQLVGTPKRVRVRFANCLSDRALIQLRFDRARNQRYFAGTARLKQLALETQVNPARMAAAMDEITARIKRAKVLADNIATKATGPQVKIADRNEPQSTQPPTIPSPKQNAVVQLSLFES